MGLESNIPESQPGLYLWLANNTWTIISEIPFPYLKKRGGGIDFPWHADISSKQEWTDGKLITCTW